MAFDSAVILAYRERRTSALNRIEELIQSTETVVTPLSIHLQSKSLLCAKKLTHRRQLNMKKKFLKYASRSSSLVLEPRQSVCRAAPFLAHESV